VQPDKPKLTLPARMDCSRPGTFAYESIHHRLPTILDRVLTENHYPEPIEKKVRALRTELLSGTVRPIQPGSYPDGDNWDAYTQPYLGMRWRELPWFFAETYFYRRVLEAVDYFDHPPDERIDPFLTQKILAWEMSDSALVAYAQRTNSLLNHPDSLPEMLFMDLWGNRADLSIWPADPGSQPIFNYDNQADLLIDHSKQVKDHIQQHGGNARIDIILDNAGLELAADLYLACFLLESDLAQTVHLHAKHHPTFVSDTMIVDINWAVTKLEQHPHPSVRTLGTKLGQHNENRLFLQADSYWNSPCAGWDMPDRIREELTLSTLVIFKGDANYRRLVGDRNWSFTTPFKDVCAYFPAAMTCLRTLKSEVLTGLAPGVERALRERDPDSFTSGRYGILQSRL